MMDGKVAQSMRDKGLDYHLNWGATLPRLREKADMIGNDYDLAIALWKENIRECNEEIIDELVVTLQKLMKYGFLLVKRKYGTV